MTFILVINVKMPTIIGFLTFINRINTPIRCFKQGKNFIFQIARFVEIQCSVEMLELDIHQMKSNQFVTVVPTKCDSDVNFVYNC